MAKQALVLGMLLLMSGCTSEHCTVAMSAADPCTNDSFTASSADVAASDRRPTASQAAWRRATATHDAADSRPALYGIAPGSVLTVCSRRARGLSAS